MRIESSFLWDQCPGELLLGCMAKSSLLEETASVFSPFDFSTSNVRAIQFLLVLTGIWCYCCFLFWPFREVSGDISLWFEFAFS